MVSGLIMKFMFYKMWLNCYDDFDVTRLDRILAHSLMNINSLHEKWQGSFWGFKITTWYTHIKKIKIIICTFVLMNINISFCYTETIMSDNENLPFFNGNLTSPISQIKVKSRNFVCEK